MGMTSSDAVTKFHENPPTGLMVTGNADGYGNTTITGNTIVNKQRWIIRKNTLTTQKSFKDSKKRGNNHSEK